MLHGFPTHSFDYRAVLDGLRRNRRVLLLDFLGYGLSAKPDIGYKLATQADIVVGFTAGLGLAEVALLTHDMGDTVGGELLARQIAGEWPIDVTRRVLANGSIYIEMAHLGGSGAAARAPRRDVAPDPGSSTRWRWGRASPRRSARNRRSIPTRSQHSGS